MRLIQCSAVPSRCVLLRCLLVNLLPAACLIISALLFFFVRSFIRSLSVCLSVCLSFINSVHVHGRNNTGVTTTTLALDLGPSLPDPLHTSDHAKQLQLQLHQLQPQQRMQANLGGINSAAAVRDADAGQLLLQGLRGSYADTHLWPK